MMVYFKGLCCVSLYVTDPNNLRLEFTVDHPEVERINADQRAQAHEALQRWLARGPYAKQRLPAPLAPTKTVAARSGKTL
jgi:hypothetical protein